MEGFRLEESQLIKPDSGAVATPSPIRMLTTLMGSVFAIELLVMVAFSELPALPSWLESILDASILSALLFPILYFAVFRPLIRLVDQHKQLSNELIKQHKHLEDLVASRMEQIQRHEEEDTLAAFVMDRYLKLSHDDTRVEYLISSVTHRFSGDAIVVAKSPDGGLNVMMLDAMGHGLSAAINALPAIQAFYERYKKGMPLETLVSEINDRVNEFTPRGHFLAATFIYLDAEESKVTGWIGGLPKVYLKSAEKITSFKSSNLSLGIRLSSEIDFEFFSEPWSSESMLVTCTDGVLEARGKEGEELGENWIFNVIQKYGSRLDKALFDKVWKESIGDEKPHDDASFLIINQTLSYHKDKQ